jgi:hypothetical protein
VIAQAILRQSIPWLVSAAQKSDSDTKQYGIKVAQAVEKFRRLVIRVKNVERGSITTKMLAQLLHDVAACFNSAFEQVRSISCLSIPGLIGFTVWG